uniref:Uncharacterized protein n=1 Tax=Leersia perrieri TaxID=77586 RepID=A0A0D9WE34_9ORYZ
MRKNEKEKKKSSPFRWGGCLTVLGQRPIFLKHVGPNIRIQCLNYVTRPEPIKLPGQHSLESLASLFPPSSSPPFLLPLRRRSRKTTCLGFRVRGEVAGEGSDLEGRRKEAALPQVSHRRSASRIRLRYNLCSLKTMVPQLKYVYKHREGHSKGCDSGVKYKIKGYKQLSWFKLTLPTNIQKLRDYGPFLTVIKISKNYSLDFLSGRTYKFDSASVEMADKQIKTHAVVITGYAIDYMLPLWEMMKSYGSVHQNSSLIGPTSDLQIEPVLSCFPLLLAYLPYLQPIDL